MNALLIIILILISSVFFYNLYNYHSISNQFENKIKNIPISDEHHHPENSPTFPLTLNSDNFERHQYPEYLFKYPLELRNPYLPASEKTPGPYMGNVIPIDIYTTGFNNFEKIGFLASGAPNYFRLQLFARRLYPTNNYEYYIQAHNGVNRYKLKNNMIRDTDYITNVPGYSGVKFQAFLYYFDNDGIRYNPYF
jgi:hypothetical protein